MRKYPKIQWKLKNNYAFTVSEVESWNILPENLFKRGYEYKDALQLFRKKGFSDRGFIDKQTGGSKCQ